VLCPRINKRVWKRSGLVGPPVETSDAVMRVDEREDLALRRQRAVALQCMTEKPGNL
jgi:hypothetical protein